MKLFCWNVNGIRACLNKGLMQTLQNHQPDVVCLQETKAAQSQVDSQSQHLGFLNSYWSSSVNKKGYSGVATFLNEEPKMVAHGLGIPAYDLEGRIVTVDYKDILIYNIYFPNGGMGEERHNFKQRFLADLKGHLAAQLAQGRTIIVCGDYNIAHTEIDIYDPQRLSKESGFLPEERQWMTQFLDLGFVDSFRHFHPDQKERYSWWSYRDFGRVDNRGWRIDYICVSKDLVGRLKSAEILDHIEGSDHCPVTLNLDL